MKVLSKEDLPLKEETVCTIGNFDGFHSGHIFLLNRVKEISEKSGKKSLVITFEPHPKKILNPNNAPCRITDLETKKELLNSRGIDYLYVINFNKKYANISPEEFIKFLSENLNCKKLVVGHDWRFGANGEGDIELAKKFGEKYGFEIEVVPPIKVDNKRVSSTMIRNLLKEGKVEEVSKLLGRTYCIKGHIIPGNKIGRKIGFPTINIKPPDDLCLKKGVYMGFVSFDSKLYPAVINYGKRPTVDGKETLIEAHILGEKIEGEVKEVKIFFKEFIREEKKFENVDELKKQIEEDVNKALKVLGV